MSALQQWLTDCGQKVKVDGDWGDKTEAAIQNFQAKEGLKVDGIVGEKTLTALRGSFGSGASEKPPGKFDLTKELASPDSELYVAIGMAEGTGPRTAARPRLTTSTPIH